MKGRKILSIHTDKKEAGRKMGQLLFNDNNLSLVEIKGMKKQTKKAKNLLR